MANFVPADVLDLERLVLANLGSVRAGPKMIRSLWADSKLTFPDRKLAILRIKNAEQVPRFHWNKSKG